MHHNLVINDGSGQPRFQTDIGIQDDRIVAVGSLTGEASRTVNATGRDVTPGFIDAHSHDDYAVLDCPLCDFKIMQGVTTEIVGNCGSGAAPANDAYRHFLRGFGAILFGPLGDFSWQTTQEFYQALEARPVALIVGSLVPHAAVRYGVLENMQRAPSREDLSAMQVLIRAGAVGMSTGLFYDPGSYAETEELIALAQVLSEYRGVYATHMRNKANGLLDSVAETLRIGAEPKISVQISHHKAMVLKNGAKSTTISPWLNRPRPEGWTWPSASTRMSPAVQQCRSGPRRHCCPPQTSRHLNCFNALPTCLRRQNVRRNLWHNWETTRGDARRPPRRIRRKYGCRSFWYE